LKEKIIYKDIQINGIRKHGGTPFGNSCYAVRLPDDIKITSRIKITFIKDSSYESKWTVANIQKVFLDDSVSGFCLGEISTGGKFNDELECDKKADLISENLEFPWDIFHDEYFYPLGGTIRGDVKKAKEFISLLINKDVSNDVIEWTVSMRSSI